MKLYLVRHGQTKTSDQGVFRGQLDVELSDEGKSQALAVGCRLSDLEQSRWLAAGPLKRTRLTAETIGQCTGLHRETWGDFDDICVGEWEGKHYDQLKKDCPDIMHRWETDPFTCNFPGGERFSDFAERVRRGVAELSAYRENAICVTHRVVIKTILCQLLNWPGTTFWSLQIDSASITVIDLKKQPVLLALNDTCHYKR